MVRFNLPKGVHRVSRQTKAGTVWHFYVCRGGPKFWTGPDREPTDPDFLIALGTAMQLPKPRQYMTPQMVDDFLSSAEMPKGERTRQDYRLWGLLFAAAFKDDPAALFEERAARAEVNDWRKKWQHSPRQYDYAGQVVTRILNWAVAEGRLKEHSCSGFKKLYSVDRSEIVWTPDDRAALLKIAPKWICRVIVAACETGLRPGDLVNLHRDQVEITPHGMRIRVKTRKRGRPAWIPVTPEMAEVIEQTPQGRGLILVSANGGKLTERRAAEGLTQWRDKAKLSGDLRLQDARGTAATRLLNAGLSLAEIAGVMGWSLRNAAAVIEHYARVSPQETDAVLAKLKAAKDRAK